MKFLEKFQKIHIKFLREKRGRGVPGRYQGAHQAGTPHGGAASPGWCHALVWATPDLPLTLSHVTFFSLPSKLQFIAQNRVLAMLALDFFDLLAHPIFAADFWRDCSLVCASSACPIRFLIGRLYLEYFVDVGDML